MLFTRLATHFRNLADIALSQKLQEELKYEQENLPEPDATPDFLKSFLEQGVWSVRFCLLFFIIRKFESPLQIEDVRGNDEVTLTRKFGDEKYVRWIIRNWQSLLYSAASVSCSQSPTLWLKMNLSRRLKAKRNLTLIILSGPRFPLQRFVCSIHDLVSLLIIAGISVNWSWSIKH